MAFAAREQLHYQACFPTLNIMEREKKLSHLRNYASRSRTAHSKEQENDIEIQQSRKLHFSTFLYIFCGSK